jgi:hypothetical protein
MRAPRLQCHISGVVMIKCILSLAAFLIFSVQAQAQTYNGWLIYPAIGFFSNTPGVIGTLTISPNQSAALTELITQQGCVPKGALSDGTLDMTISFSGVMYGHDVSKTYIRISFCDDALVGGSSLANLQVRLATSAAGGGKLNSKTNLGAWMEGATAAYSYQTVGREVVSFIGLQSPNMIGSWLPITAGQVWLINMETPAIGPNTNLNLSNSLGGSYIRIAAHP